MANESAMLKKIERSLINSGVTATSDSVSVVAAGITITLVSADIQSPMGGVTPASSPFLGIGVAAPHVIKLKGAAGMNVIADIIADAAAAKVLAIVAHMANDIVIEAGDTTTELVRIPGHSDVFGLGQ